MDLGKELVGSTLFFFYFKDKFSSLFNGCHNCVMQEPSDTAISSKEIPHLTVGNVITVIKPIITGGVSCTVKLCNSAQMRKT